jgi:hypothetical protein
MKRKNIILVLSLVIAIILSGNPAVAQVKTTDKRVLLTNRKSYKKIDSTKINKDMQTMSGVNLMVVANIKQLNGQGPSPVPIPLGESLPWQGLDQFNIDAQSIISLSLSVYRDVVKGSFIFYYVPARYNIKWNPEDGYYMSISYAKESDNAQQNTLLQARMTPGVRNSDHQLLKELIKVYLRNSGESSSKVILQPLPANYVPFFDIPSVGDEGVILTGINPDNRELVISITTDEATKELLVDQLGNVVGLAGNIVLEPEKVTENQPDMSNKFIDANLKFCDNNAYARKLWEGDLSDPHSFFTNQHPLPVQLKFLCYLYSSGTNLEVRGYDLGNQTLAPDQRARIDNSVISKEIASDKSLIAWYEYSLDCDSSSLNSLVQNLTGGVGSVPTQQLGLKMIQAQDTFEQYGINLVVVTLRSRYFDPDGEEVILNSYELTIDNTDINCAPLFLWDEQAKSGDIDLYEFKITLVTNTGDVYEDPQWRSPKGISAAGKLYIGATIIESLLANQ